MLSTGHNEISAFHSQPCFSSSAGCQLTEGQEECQHHKGMAAGRAETRSRQQAGTPPLSGTVSMFSLLKLPPASSHCDPAPHVLSSARDYSEHAEKDCHDQGENREQGLRWRGAPVSMAGAFSRNIFPKEMPQERER